MNSGLTRLFGTAILVTVGAQAAIAQNPSFPGWSGCIDPLNKTPFSNPSLIQWQGNSLMQAALGVVGTVQYGQTGSPPTDTFISCFGNPPGAATGQIPGGISFANGTEGSVQSSFDDGMALTFGYPYPARPWGYAALVVDGKQNLVGSTGFVTSFVGSSDRYIFAEEVLANTDISLRIDLIGDAARLSWTLRNLDANAHTLGIWVGQWAAMITTDGQVSGGPPANNEISYKPGYIVVPGAKPPTTEHRYIRAQDPTGFPSYVNFDFGQTNAFGIRIDNQPTDATQDPNGLNSDASTADEFALGQEFFLLGSPRSQPTAFPDHMFGPGNTGGDVDITAEPGFIQKFNGSLTAPGTSSQIVQYYHSTWGQSNYFRPYSVVVDAPRLMPADVTDPSGLAQPPGGYTIRVYVDNTRGFSSVDQTIELDNVTVTLKLPSGINLASGEVPTKVIPRIQPANPTIDFVDFKVKPDGITVGQLPYSVTVAPTPGPVKTINGTIVVAGTPKLVLVQGPNLISTPFNFNDTSWDAILGLVQPTDYQAFDWDPQQAGYVVSTSRTRGKGTWIVANTAIGVHNLQSNPQQPSDIATGAGNIQLFSGWNLIANPYNYAVPLGQLVGVSAANNQQSYKWADLVAQGFVSGALAFYNVNTGSYSYIQDVNELLQPNVGYWVFVATAQQLTLNYPPVFQEFLPGSSRKASNTWTQTDNMWRLQLVARTAKALDDQNYIGLVPTAKQVQQLQIAKPPMLPGTTGVQLSISAALGTKQMPFAQVLSATAGKQQYPMSVTSKQDGDVTLTWPNLATLPKNVQFRLIDKANGITRVLNQTSGYVFTAKANTTRQFTLQVEPKTASRAVIGNVIVSRPSRDRNAPFTITYTLGGDATTAIRILTAGGREVFTATPGRADRAGDNTITWNLRDNANRNVAPGSYHVVITAQTADGNLVRRTVVVNVTR